MREIRYFGLNQWDDILSELSKLKERGRTNSVYNITCRFDYGNLQYVVAWDEELIDLENK